MANSLKLYEAHLFSASPNSCHCTTVLNANCSKMLHNAVIIGMIAHYTSSIRQRLPRDLITLCFIILCLNILHWKQTPKLLTSINSKRSLIDECRAQFDQSIVDAARPSSHWHRRLSACVRVVYAGQTPNFEHKFVEQFWSEQLYQLICHLCAKNDHSLWEFDEVMTKRILLVFWGTVYK